METFYDVFHYKGEGYKTLLNFEAWKIAALRYAERFEKNNFYRVERHFETDEVFVLLEGDAYLIVSDNEDIPKVIDVINMEKGKVYNIRINN